MFRRSQMACLAIESSALSRPSTTSVSVTIATNNKGIHYIEFEALIHAQSSFKCN
ncbi:hypothetical protein DPMN_022125 [Dreissena polymorpha]|uniref:Uncharacterized protein n=1 Tax=Dreissena polymorpha TaxID=45954 RepID=A0A9D4S9U0_DREPO|nr:hypothetical protein DPMN_022125 [Dreissena polymorpha]